MIKEDFKQVLCELINVNNGKKIKKWLSKEQFENLPFNLCLPHEYEDRKKEVLN